MVSLALWCTSFALQLIILSRGFLTRALLKFPYFYAYTFSVLVGDAFVFVAWRAADPALYQKSYWAWQFLTLVVGCGIILEIFKHVLAPYPGAERFATAVGLFTFGVIFCVAIVYRFLPVGRSTLSGSTFELERDVRTVQALFLFGILAVISYYGIQIGKNLKGMISGYGLYIGTSLLTLAVRSYAGAGFNRVWNIVQPCSFNVSVMIWVIALWSFHPNPVPDASIQLEEDYEAFAARTKRALVAMRSHLAKTSRT